MLPPNVLLLFAAAAATFTTPVRADPPAPVGNIQFNLTVPPTSPILSYYPGFEADADAKVDNHTKMLLWKTPTDLPYYVNFTDYQAYRSSIASPPTVQVQAFANNVYFWGKYDGWNSTTKEPYVLTTNGNNQQMSLIDGLQSYDNNILATAVNMSDGFNNVTLGISDGIQGGAAFSIEQVTVTTYMQLATKQKKPDWNSTVNQTFVPFTNDGSSMTSYIQCDGAWSASGSTSYNNGTQSDYKSISVNGGNNQPSCKVSIPAKTSYIVLWGTQGSTLDGLKISGLGSVEYYPNNWASDTVLNSSLFMYPLNPDYQYTLEITSTESNNKSDSGHIAAGLRGITLYGIQVHDSWVNHVPWPLVGGIAGGVVAVLILAAVFWRYGAMFFRRRRRDSVLFEEASERRETERGGNYRSSTYNDTNDTMEMPLLGAAAPTGRATAGDYHDFGPMTHSPRASVAAGAGAGAPEMHDTSTYQQHRGSTQLSRGSADVFQPPQYSTPQYQYAQTPPGSPGRGILRNNY